MNTRDVVLAAARDDNDALTALLRMHHDRVFRFGLAVCRDGADADDAVQEAFIRLARRPDVIAAPSALSWLMTVVRNMCMRLLRPWVQQRRALGDDVVDANDVTDSQLDPYEALKRWELIQRVHAAIAALDRPSREVLVLRDLEGLSGDETCRALDLPLATMKTRLHRARAQLRERLREQNIDDDALGN